MKTTHIFCLFAGHSRSRRRSYVDPLDSKQRSYCRRCDVPMMKSWPEGWRVNASRLQFSCVLHRLDEPGTTRA